MLVPEIKRVFEEERIEHLPIAHDKVKSVVSVLTAAHEMMRSKVAEDLPIPSIADLAKLREVKRDLVAYVEGKKDIAVLQNSLEKHTKVYHTNWLESCKMALLAIANKELHCDASPLGVNELAGVAFYCGNCDDTTPLRFPTILEHKCGIYTPAGTGRFTITNAIESKTGSAWTAQNFFAEDISGVDSANPAFECIVCSGDVVDAAKRCFLTKDGEVRAFYNSCLFQPR